MLKKNASKIRFLSKPSIHIQSGIVPGMDRETVVSPEYK